MAEYYKDNILRVRAVRGGRVCNRRFFRSSSGAGHDHASGAQRRSVHDQRRSPFSAATVRSIRLIGNVHYRIYPFIATLEIQFFALPPEFAVPGHYDFVVTYSLLTSECTAP